MLYHFDAQTLKIVHKVIASPVDSLQILFI